MIAKLRWSVEARAGLDEQEVSLRLYGRYVDRNTGRGTSRMFVSQVMAELEEHHRLAWEAPRVTAKDINAGVVTANTIRSTDASLSRIVYAGSIQPSPPSALGYVNR